MPPAKAKVLFPRAPVGQNGGNPGVRMLVISLLHKANQVPPFKDIRLLSAGRSFSKKKEGGKGRNRGKPLCGDTPEVPVERRRGDLVPQKDQHVGKG